MRLQQKAKRKIQLAIVLIALGILLAGCQTAVKTDEHKMDTAAPGAPKTQPNVEKPGENEVQIVIENFAYVPSEVTISPGTKVTWINKDEAPHTATSVDQKFNSGGLDTDDKFSFVFTEKGDYQYFCTLHPHMKAQIKVK
jgi:plastocyanin